MKAFTDLEQSKKLAEILPLESADTLHCIDFDGDLLFTVPKQYSGSFRHQPELIIPCWSLAALMEVLPNKIISHETAFDDEDAEGITDIYYKRIESTEDDCYVCLYAGNGYKYKCTSDNLVDVCVEMILKLCEHKIL